MTKSKSSLYAAAVTALLCPVLGVGFSHADTVIMKDGKELKGVVVEEYKDRVKLSTVEGEQEITRKDIKRIVFDLEEQNLLRLAYFYQDQLMFDKAYYYFNKVLEIDPGDKKALEGRNYVRACLEKNIVERKLDHLQKLEQGESWARSADKEQALTKEERIKDALGIVFQDVRQSFEVFGVISFSPADKAGIRKGDILYSAWGRALSYMQPGEVVEKLLAAPGGEIKLALLRSFDMELADTRGGYDELMGCELVFPRFENLVIGEVYPGGAAEKAGLEESDVIEEIRGKDTRYMLPREVKDLIERSRGQKLSLKIKRDVTIWKGFAY